MPKVISLFAGAGGLDLGFQRAGFDITWANEWDKDAVKTYRENLGEHVHGGDILGLKPPRGQVDVLIGGPPCQGFSVAGKMDPKDPRSRHVFTYMDWVERTNPQAFVMENVKSLAMNTRFQVVRETLFAWAEDLGYSTQLFLLNASLYGVPQARERMFLVGIKGRVPTRPKPKSGKIVTVRKALSALPEFGDPGNDAFVAAKITPAKKPVLRKSPYAGMLFNGAGRPLDPDQPSATLPASMGGNRTPIIDQKHWEEGGESWIVSYHRKLSKGGKPVTRVPAYLRRLTFQESQALQSFPRDWQFQGKQSSQFNQLGNAVPPLLAEAVAAQLLRDLR